MTAVVQKTKVQPTWDIAKVREGAAAVAVNGMVSALTVLDKDGLVKYEEQWTNNKVENIKKHNVKTPLDLVKAIAEFETNVFGSVIDYSGDENSATYSYESCGCYNVAMLDGKFTPELGEKLEKVFEQSTQRLAKSFGFKVTVKKEGSESFPVTTFSK